MLIFIKKQKDNLFNGNIYKTWQHLRSKTCTTIVDRTTLTRNSDDMNKKKKKNTSWLNQ